MNYYGALKVEKFMPINQGGGKKTLLGPDAKPFGICNAFAQCYDTDPGITCAKNPSENGASLSF